MIPSRPPFARGAVAMIVGLLALLALAPQASAATSFVRAGELTIAGPFFGSGDGNLYHQRRLAVEHTTGNVLRTDVVADQVVVYSPNGTGLDQLTAFGSGQLSDPHGIAVDQANGDVYVADAGNNQIVRYNSDGQPVPTYTLDAGYTSPTQGSGAGELGSFAAAIALDPTTGDLLVADPGNNLVKRFDDTGAYDSFSFDGTGSPSTFTGLQDIAIDSTGDVIVVDASGGDPADGFPSRVERFDSAGVWEATVGPVAGAANVAIRPATDEVVVSGNQDAINRDQTPTLYVFDSPTASAELSFAGAAQYSTVSGLAVDDGPAGQLFVATDSSRGNYPGQYGVVSVQVFDPVVPAAPTIDAEASASDVTATSATLNATVDPNNAEATYHFEYGTTASYGSSTDPASAGSGGSPTPVSAPISGLQPNTTYHVRVVVDNGIGGPVEGTDQTFTTAEQLAPVVEPPAATATGVGIDAATLNATINPGYSETTYHFEYGTTTSYGSQTTPASAGAGNQPVPVTEALSGLEPSTTYHFRIVADNEVGPPVTGADRTFTTLDAPPIVAAGAATDVGTRTATLHGTVDTHGIASKARFYVSQTDGPHSRSTPLVDLAAVDGPQAISAVLEDLPPDGTFRVRVSATTNGSGATATSDPVEFSTQPLPPYVPSPPVPVDPTPYGCDDPKLTGYEGTARPGGRVTLVGSDLGVWGNVAVGGEQAEVVDYGSTRITIVVPADAAGKPAVTVNCAKATNAISLTIAKPPSNRVGTKVGANGALTLRVPGAGRLTVKGAGVRSVTRRTGGKRTVKVKLKLTRAGRKALAKSKGGKLTRRVRISFRPTGGSARTVTRAVTFKKQG